MATRDYVGASKITDSRNVKPSMVRLISSTYATNTRAPYDSATAMKRLLHALRGITNPTVDSYHWEACHTSRHSSASLIKARESLLALKVP